MSKQVLVYICSPYKAIFDTLAQNTDVRRELVLSNAYAIAINYSRNAIEKVKEQSTSEVNYIAFSPVLYFKDIAPSYNPFSPSCLKEEERILEECLEILKRCDVVFVVESPYTHKSKGIQKELDLARSLGKKVIFEREGQSILPTIKDVSNYKEWLKINGFSHKN
ncbi:hypothetical protein B6S12_09785 [Helicobacter valdiviensis]|uniref:DUF1937 domain-containing protein n=1 Tax=Helicobacter valdiviensis TaxID=1458358 RepID=A0A2W6MRX2_9HELI|nr:DUF4406 domain-containing protein [Helicobacter valdiviensis]PZT47314.1 hypothetical protein B6S12_09785 [Helicobacter valdiviensis]